MVGLGIFKRPFSPKETYQMMNMLMDLGMILFGIMFLIILMNLDASQDIFELLIKNYKVAA